MLKRLTVKISMRMFTSIEYTRNMPIEDLMDLMETIAEIQEE